MNETNNEVRYTVQVEADEAFGHYGVTFWLFHKDALPEEVYARLIPAHLNRPDSDVRTAADQTFSHDEVDELARYFTRYFGWQVVSEKFEAALGENDFGDCMRSVGDNEGFAEFWRDAGYDLRFKVAGYYNLRDSDGPSQAARRERLLAQLADVEDVGLLLDLRQAAQHCGLTEEAWVGLVAQKRCPPPRSVGRRGKGLWGRHQLDDWLVAGRPCLARWERDVMLRKNRKARLLQQYATRRPKLFLQFDGFHRPGGGDSVTHPDDEGHCFTYCDTWDLMHGADVRVMIPVGTSQATALALLRKIVATVESAGEYFDRSRDGGDELPF
jgi:hypothetical protein